MRRGLGLPPVPVVVYTGRLSPEKGVDVLVDAWAEARRRGCLGTLCLVGDGPERQALERRAVALGVRGATRFAGPTADVAPWLQAADVFVLPSRQEGLSVALLEAMAAGVPAVATEVGGTREAVGGTAVLVPPADPRALAEALCALLDEPGRARELGEAARVRVLSRFGILNVARRHLELYREVGEGRPRAAVGEGRPRAAGGGHGGWASAGRVPRVVVPRDHGDVHPGRGP